MREKPRDKGRLEHMLQAIDNVAEFIVGKNYEDFENDKILYFAVVKNIEIVGEAAYKLTHEFTENHPTAPWKDIIGMRQMLVHGYYVTTPKIVWNTAKADLPELRPLIVGFIEELEQNSSDTQDKKDK